ncbi:MAG: hypothetical protein J2P36_24435, partial [Ktedonobacteraceae bacterium]|nr:hypothetical protein [Ktedonobacteraceae bacterium]
MSQQDRHLTTEQLSAFLDEQAEEQASLEEHLKSCAQCQLRLADLRQTVAFLHALPQPQASRSFLLPEDTPIHQARLHTSNDQASSTKRGTPARILAWPRAIRNTVRAVSVLAAVLGIVFLLSAFLPFSPGGITATSSGNSAAPGASYQQNRATAPATSAGNDSAAKPTQVAATATAHAA